MKFGKTALVAAALSAVATTSPVSAQDAYMGQIETFAFGYCPNGWVPADGTLYPVNQYAAMYSLLGTLYGGNGTQTFAVPDLRGRVVIGMGQGTGLPAYQRGQVGGTPQTAIAVNNMPAHTHTATLRAHNAPGTSDNPTNALMADFPDGQAIYAPGPADVAMAADAIQVQVVGGGQPFSVMQPYLAMQVCIAMQGLYPPRP